MKTKLTLNIDEAAIKKAKQYSRRKKTSVSKLAEDYFNSLTDKPAVKKADSILSLKGILKGKFPEDKSYKEIIYEAIKEKHLK